MTHGRGSSPEQSDEEEKIRSSSIIGHQRQRPTSGRHGLMRDMTRFVEAQISKRRLIMRNFYELEFGAWDKYLLQHRKEVYVPLGYFLMLW
jgi:hypothetical protein